MADEFLIVGAGPVGLTLANLLAKANKPFRIIDKKSEISKHSKALVVHSKTLELLDSELDLAEEFINSGNKLKRAQIFADSKAIMDLDLSQTPSKFNFPLAISQRETERILEEQLKKSGHAVEWETELLELNNYENKATATTSNKENQRQSNLYRYIFACDGAHSICRKLLGVEFKGKSYQQEFFLADVHLENDLEQTSLYAFLTKSELLFMAPFREQGHWRLITTVAPNFKGDRVEPQIEDIYQHIKSIDAIKLKATKASWLSYFHVHCRIVDRYDHGNVFLLGDAAHIHSPVGGKGMNAGMHDAFSAAKNLLVGSIDKYSPERRPFGLDILKTTDFMTNMLISRNFLSHNLQKLLLPIALGGESQKKKVIKNLAMLD